MQKLKNIIEIFLFKDGKLDKVKEFEIKPSRDVI